jgi:type III restriction enzyme
MIKPKKDVGDLRWKIDGHSNPVRLRWLVTTAIKSRLPRALTITDLKDSKFDVRVQVQSSADKQADDLAKKIVEAYFENSELLYESKQPFSFGAMRVAKNATAFTHSLYERYSGLNKFELEFAEELDKTKLTWHRNPANGGFHIPLLSEGDTASFYPDFIAWKKGMVYCLDTKGGHLLTDAVARKLFDINEGNKIKLKMRFVSVGKQSKLQGKATGDGYTVWKMKSGTPKPIHVDTLKEAMDECLK